MALFANRFAGNRLGSGLSETKRYAVTVLPDGIELVADLSEQPGQQATADMLGCSVREMNETHDLFHTLVAEAIGLRCSPTLWAVAHGEATEEFHGLEEDAILAVQKFFFAAVKRGWKK